MYKIDFFVRLIKFKQEYRIDGMKNKLLILLALLISSSCVVQAQTSSDVKEAIQKYKAQNYVGCLQDTIEITEKDPSNALAYYYMGISYVQIGNADKALEAYDKVLTLSTSGTLNEYAQRGSLCVKSPDECRRKGPSDLEDKLNDEYYKFINSTKSISKDVSDKLDEIQIEIMKQNINKDVDKKSEAPSNDEIAEAVKTLAKIGINPLSQQSNSYIQAQQAMMQNPEYMQLQMLLGSNNNNNGNDFMSMLPYFMSQNGDKNSNISADALKNMMMSSMMGNLSTTLDFDNK